MNINIEENSRYTNKFLEYKFRNYYINNNDIDMPIMLKYREWGFIPFQKNIQMKRHISFKDKQSFYKYIIYYSPKHIFYSSAYYERPDNNNMTNKNWLGADLIFDLDGDHLNLSNDNYVDMLTNIKNETLKLLSFLIDDFGFKEEQLEIIFSGNRGYHIHVYDNILKKLNSQERKEIIDYITGKGLDIQCYVQNIEYKNKNKKIYKLINYKYGWGKRITDYLIEYISKNIVNNEKEFFNQIKNLNIISIRNLIKLKELILNTDMLNIIRNNGILDFPILHFDSLIHYILFENKNLIINKYKCEIDEPVTSDIKRLIRFPGSLHGSTGLLVKKIKLNEFEKFNPLNDAVVFNSKLIKINVLKNLNIEFMNKEYELYEGIQYLPEHIAVYLMCKGVANYGSYGD